MLRRHRQPQEVIATDESRAFDDFHEWVLSLPWVVERPGVGSPGVRLFGVDCEPLGRRQLLLLTGLQPPFACDGLGLMVIVPTDTAEQIEAVGWGRCVAPMSGEHKLVAVYGDALPSRAEIEALVLTAYGNAMS